MNSQVLAFERFLFSFFKLNFFFYTDSQRWFFFPFKKHCVVQNSFHWPSSLQDFWEWKLWITRLNAEVVLWNNPDIFCSYVSFPEKIILEYLYLFPVYLCQVYFPFLLCLHCHLEWKCFSNFMHIFHGIRLVAQWGAKPKKPKRDSTMTDPSCVSRLEQLDSANLRPGEIGEMWVCFRSRGFRINYDLTVDLWWVYSQEVSYSRCITGKAWADVTWGCSLRRMAVNGVKFLFKSPAVWRWVWKWSEDSEWRWEDHLHLYIWIVFVVWIALERHQSLLLLMVCCMLFHSLARVTARTALRNWANGEKECR